MIKLLLIEDDKLDQLSFQLAARDYPYQCYIVASIQAARRSLSGQHFDVIIADYRMPDGTAFDILDRYADIPIIIITGAGDEETAVRAMKAGAYDYITKDHERLYLKVLPLIIDNAIQRKKMILAEQEQRSFADALRDIARVLNSTLQVDEVLHRILINVQRVVQHEHSTIMLLQDGVAKIVQGHGWTDTQMQAIRTFTFSLDAHEPLRQMYLTRQYYRLAEVQTSPGWIELPETASVVHSFLAAPICTEEQVIGFLNITSHHPNLFTAVQGERLQAFADQAAIALANAQLYQQAQELAAMQERQRLARDLHDSVTQTLFSAHVVADSLIRIWERDPLSIRDDLVELSLLTKGALAEMRTLLLELRPQTLIDTDLGDLLKNLAETAKGQSRLQISLTIEGELQLPSEVQIALFRIAQESINNVVKHARASTLHITLLRQLKHVHLKIEDNGKGFDLSAIHAPHLGIRIMYERSEAANVRLKIDSQPGKGTVVIAEWRPHG